MSPLPSVCASTAHPSTRYVITDLPSQLELRSKPHTLHYQNSVVNRPLLAQPKGNSCTCKRVKCTNQGVALYFTKEERLHRKCTRSTVISAWFRHAPQSSPELLSFPQLLALLPLQAVEAKHQGSAWHVPGVPPPAQRQNSHF